METSWIQPKHTQCRPDNLAVTGILIRAALEADGEDGEEGHVAHSPGMECLLDERARGELSSPPTL